jgi:iron complex transport system ATP-binding protein
MSQAELSARGISVSLGGRRVLEGVDFDALPGQITAIVGPNGSGKTTLLKALSGLVPYQGQVTIAGQDLAAVRPGQRAQLLAYLPQTSALSAMLSVRQVVALGRYATHPGWLAATARDDAAVAAALDRLQLTALGDQAYPKLSGGQQRLVLLARALATGARILLLDEPTASLDVKHALESFAVLRDLAEDGYCIVLVLHDLDDVQRHARHALLLSSGSARARGAPHDAAFVSAAEDTYDVSIVASDRIGFRHRQGSATGTEEPS